jgi:EAL domain-containing protein (putative c-di-GMP-specific phosphodiesterase class I)
VKTKYSHIITLAAALLAFVPVVGTDWLMNAYIRAREQALLQQAVGTISERIQTGAYDAIDGLRRIIADSPSLCAPTFTENVRKVMEASLYVREVTVENPDGVEYCDALGAGLKFSQLAPDLPIPGVSETIGVGKLGALTTPVLRLTEAVGTTRLVSAYVPIVSTDQALLGRRFDARAGVRISLTNGTSLMTAGYSSILDGNAGDVIGAVGFAGELPIRVEAAVPFAASAENYADLRAGFTVMACFMSGAFLLLALQYVRRTKLPAFDLERAIASGEIAPYYQPVINLKTGTLAGCEVLCRWEKKNGQIVMPGAFIDYAENTGLAIPMTISLMQQVRQDLADLCATYPEMKISVNLFEGHFRDTAIVEDVRAIFGGSTIGFRQLVFEITERHPLANSVSATSVIGGLHALGCRLAMDDVGTGHSNLAYMQTLGVDVIKIDRVFIDMIKPDTQQVPVLDGLITMCHELGTEIVAEGVETEAQAHYLRRHGVIMAQGYLFAPALKVAAFRELAEALGGHPDVLEQPEKSVASVAA